MTTARSTPDPVADERDVPALRIAGLTKSFGDTAAVSDVELTVASGSFLGLVGPNGAGKTTLLSMAIGLLRPDRGTAFVLGEDVWSKSGSTPGQAADRGAARRAGAAAAADRGGAAHLSRPAARHAGRRGPRAHRGAA